MELADERERHIRERHPDLLPEHREAIAVALADPEEVRRNARLGRSWRFIRWFESVRGGKYVVVVVVSATEPAARHWIITAYIARKLTGGEVEWRRS